MVVNLIYNEVTQRYEASYPSVGPANTFATSLGPLAPISGVLFGDGTSGAPSMAFASEPTLGFWRSTAATVTLQGALITTGRLSAVNSQGIAWVGRAFMTSPSDATINLSDSGTLTIGVRLKFDALPTVSSGFGTSPAVTAGSTPLAGSINVGTGGAATTGVILWNGTAFPSAPFIVVTCSLGAVPTIAVATTTQVTLTTSVAWPASTIVNWIAISARA